MKNSDDGGNYGSAGQDDDVMSGVEQPMEENEILSSSPKDSS
mgnify:CR=1 FL=1